jgi:IS30 family transposase
MGKQYTQLSAAEREQISRGLAARRSQGAIARELGRSTSTIWREIHRNSPSVAHYRAESAQGLARGRLAKPRRARKLSCARRWQYVRTRLRRGHSPEQIAARLRVLYPDDMSKHLSHETIYKAIYVLPRGELRKELIACLRKSKPKRGLDRRTLNRGSISDSVPTIHERPLVVENREQAGHWEGDLIKGCHNRSGIATLVERKSRYLMLLKIKGTNAYDVRKAMEERFKRLPMALRRTLTYDRGSEMAEYERLTERIQLQVYFADPRSPWQRGTNENTNGLLRQYFPKRMDLSGVTHAEINRVQRLMNGRPRKILTWATPEEVFKQDLRLTNVALGS